MNRRSMAIVAAIGLTSGWFYFNNSKTPGYETRLRIHSETPITDTKKMRWVSIGGRTPLEVGENFLALQRAKIELRDYHELVPQVSRTPLGPRIIYQIRQDGVPIIGMNLRLRLNRELEVIEFENRYRPIHKIEIDAPLKPEEVLERVADRYRFAPTSETLAFATKVIFAKEGDSIPELAYTMPMSRCGPRSPHCQVVFRASDGQLLARSVARAEFY